MIKPGDIGLGAIGRRVAQLAEAFGCKVLCYSASGHKYDSRYEQTDFDTLLAKSDFISVHAPLNAYTENLFTLDAFKKMKNTAIFINVARGALVNEQDLYTALTTDEIAGAALDVLCREPMDPENPLTEDTGQHQASDHTSYCLGCKRNTFPGSRGGSPKYTPFPKGRYCKPGLLKRRQILP